MSSSSSEVKKDQAKRLARSIVTMLEVYGFKYKSSEVEKYLKAQLESGKQLSDFAGDAGLEAVKAALSPAVSDRRGALRRFLEEPAVRSVLIADEHKEAYNALRNMYSMSPSDQAKRDQLKREFDEIFDEEEDEPPVQPAPPPQPVKRQRRA